MLLRYRLTFLSAITAMVLLASCSSKSNKQGRLVPKEAAIVVHFNGASLNSKLPWEEIKNNTLFQEMYSDSAVPAFVKSVLDNPENSGIDIKNDMIIFGQKDSVGGIIVFTGTVKDAAKFKQFNTDLTKGGSETREGDNSYISKAPVCVGWNNDKFVYVVDAPQLDGGRHFRQYMDSNYMERRRDVGATCRSIFALKESNSLGDDGKFTDLVKKDGDIHFWINSEQLQKGMGGMEDMGPVNLGKLYEGSFSAVTVNFDNGQINIDARSYAGKELSEVYKKYSGNKINEDMIRRIPSKDVAALFAFNFKPQGIIELLKVMGIEGYANIGLAFLGFTLEDFVKANKGDIVLSVSDFKQVTDSSTTWVDGKPQRTARTKMEPNVLFAAAINDKSAFDQLIRAGKKILGEENDAKKVSYAGNEKYFAIGNSKENVDQYIAAGSDNKFDFLSKINGGPFGGYINFQFILKAMESDIKKDSSNIEIYDASVKLWDNAYIKGGDYSNGSLHQTAEINFIDKSTNSLKQLNQYLGKVARVMEEKHKKGQWVPAPVIDTMVTRKK